MMASRSRWVRVEGKGDGAGIGTEVVMGQRRHLAVPPVDRGPDDPVVVQRSHVVPALDGIDTEDGAPCGIDRLVGLETDLGGVEALRGQQVGVHHQEHAACEQQEEEGHGDRAGASHDDHRSRHEDRGRQHDRRGRPDRSRQVDDHGAGQPGADEVGEIQAAHAFGPAAEERGDDHAGRDEGEEDQEADGQELPHALGRRHRAVVPDGQRVERDVGHDDIARDDTERADEKAPQEHRVGPGFANSSGHRHQHTAGTDAQECQADDEVRVVVEQLVGDDPRVTDLDEKGRKAHEEDLGVVPLPACPVHRSCGDPRNGPGLERGHGGLSTTRPREIGGWWSRLAALRAPPSSWWRNAYAPTMLVPHQGAAGAWTR